MPLFSCLFLCLALHAAYGSQQEGHCEVDRGHALLDQALRFIELLPPVENRADELPLQAFIQAVELVDEADKELTKARDNDVEPAHVLLQDAKLRLQEAYAFLYKGAEHTANEEIKSVLEEIQDADILTGHPAQRSPASHQEATHTTSADQPPPFQAPHAPRVSSSEPSTNDFCSSSDLDSSSSEPDASSSPQHHHPPHTSTNIPLSEPGPVPFYQRHAREWRDAINAAAEKIGTTVKMRVQRLPVVRALQQRARSVAQRVQSGVSGLLNWPRMVE